MKIKKILYLFISISLLYTSPSVMGGGTNDIYIRIAKYKDDKICAISYTFDDGLKEHYSLVFPEMKKRNLKGTFWINGAKVNKDKKHIADTTRVNWDELRRMAAAGHEISNHGWAHRKLTKISYTEAKEEIWKNDSIILREIRVPSRTFCFPYNAHNDTVRELASEGRIGIRTKQISVGGKSTPERLDQWVKTLIETSDWGVGMTHGITYGYDAFKSSSILWDHWDKVSANRDKIWVETFRNVMSYVQERDHIILHTKQVDGNTVVTPELLLDKKLFTEYLTMVIESGRLINKIKVKQGKKTLPVKQQLGKILFDFNPGGESIVIIMK